MTSRRRPGLALLWVGLLVLAGAWISSSLHFSGDLRRFMPAARTPAQRLLLDELGKGPALRLVLSALSDDRPEALVAMSQSMHNQLAKDARFTFVANGGDYLQGQFEARIQNLGSPAKSLVEPLLAADLTGDDYKDQLRTLHAVIICSITALPVFSLLALSSIQVLRAIGSGMALDVLANFASPLLIVRGAPPRHRC
jgi:predicted exporter